MKWIPLVKSYSYTLSGRGTALRLRDEGVRTSSAMNFAIIPGYFAEVANQGKAARSC